MKNVVLPFLVILFAGCAIQNLPPAGPSNKAMKKANVILIETSDSAEQSFKNMKSILRGQGYSFKTANGQQFKLDTNYKTYGENNVKLSTDVLETDSVSIVEITGIIKTPQGQYRQEYGGGKPSTTNQIKKKGGYNPAWDIMQAIADEYPDGVVLYERRNT